MQENRRGVIDQVAATAKTVKRQRKHSESAAKPLPARSVERKRKINKGVHASMDAFVTILYSSGNPSSSGITSSGSGSGSACTMTNSERYASSGSPASNAGRLMMMPSML